MAGRALGLLEVAGLAAAYACADSAAKTAAVELLGLEPSKGSGKFVIKLAGEVGAVTAAVEAAEDCAGRMGRPCVTKIIARADRQVANLFAKNLEI